MSNWEGVLYVVATAPLWLGGGFLFARYIMAIIFRYKVEQSVIRVSLFGIIPLPTVVRLAAVFWVGQADFGDPMARTQPLTRALAKLGNEAIGGIVVMRERGLLPYGGYVPWIFPMISFATARDFIAMVKQRQGEQRT